MRILIIEDDESVRAIVRKYLEQEYFAVDVAENGETGLRMAKINEYDLIVLDYLLPDKDGSDVCRELRECGIVTRVLVLSSLVNVHDKVTMFTLGADDYLTKPFSLGELRARIGALLRRPLAMIPEVVTIAHLTIDSRQQKVLSGESELYLTRKEFTLLEYFARNVGTVVSRGMIMEHVWNMNADPFSNTIEAHIFSLRKKIAHGDAVLIHTIPGRGYRLAVDV